MQHGIQLKKDAVNRLEEKRKEIDISANTSSEPVTKKQKKVAVAPAAGPKGKADQKEQLDKKMKPAKSAEPAVSNNGKGMKRKR